eukprot:666626-Rhodomonas_salina.2
MAGAHVVSVHHLQILTNHIRLLPNLISFAQHLSWCQAYLCSPPRPPHLPRPRPRPPRPRSRPPPLHCPPPPLPPPLRRRPRPQCPSPSPSPQNLHCLRVPRRQHLVSRGAFASVRCFAGRRGKIAPRLGKLSLDGRRGHQGPAVSFGGGRWQDCTDDARDAFGRLAVGGLLREQRGDVRVEVFDLVVQGAELRLLLHRLQPLHCLRTHTHTGTSGHEKLRGLVAWSIEGRTRVVAREQPRGRGAHLEERLLELEPRTAGELAALGAALAEGPKVHVVGPDVPLVVVVLELADQRFLRHRAGPVRPDQLPRLLQDALAVHPVPRPVPLAVLDLPHLLHQLPPDPARQHRRAQVAQQLRLLPAHVPVLLQHHLAVLLLVLVQPCLRVLPRLHDHADQRLARDQRCARARAADHLVRLDRAVQPRPPQPRRQPDHALALRVVLQHDLEVARG